MRKYSPGAGRRNISSSSTSSSTCVIYSPCRSYSVREVTPLCEYRCPEVERCSETTLTMTVRGIFFLHHGPTGTKRSTMTSSKKLSKSLLHQEIGLEAVNTSSESSQIHFSPLESVLAEIASRKFRKSKDRSKIMG